MQTVNGEEWPVACVPGSKSKSIITSVITMFATGVAFIVLGLYSGGVIAVAVGVLILVPVVIVLIPRKSNGRSVPGSYEIDTLALSRAYGLYVYLSHGSLPTSFDLGENLWRTPADDVRDAVVRGDYNVRIDYSSDRRAYWRKITEKEAAPYAHMAPSGYMDRLKTAVDGVPAALKDYSHVIGADGEYHLYRWQSFSGIKNNCFPCLYVMPMQAGAQPFIAAIVFDPDKNVCKLMRNNTMMNDPRAVKTMNSLIKTGIYK